MEKLGLFYVQPMNNMLVLAPTKWHLTKAIGNGESGAFIRKRKTPPKRGLSILPGADQSSLTHYYMMLHLIVIPPWALIVRDK